MKSTELKEGHLLQGEFLTTFAKQLISFQLGKEEYFYQKVGIQLEDKTIEVIIHDEVFQTPIKRGNTIFLRGSVTYQGGGDSHPRINAHCVRIADPIQIDPGSAKPANYVTRLKKVKAVYCGHEVPEEGVTYAFVEYGRLHYATWWGTETDLNRLIEQKVVAILRESFDCGNVSHHAVKAAQTSRKRVSKPASQSDPTWYDNICSVCGGCNGGGNCEFHLGSGGYL